MLIELTPRATLTHDSGETRELGEVFVVGRSRDVDWSVPDGTVARMHLRLQRLPSGDVELQHLGSTNGVRVNARELGHDERVRLRDGDRIELGRHAFTFAIAPVEEPFTEAQLAAAAAHADDEAGLAVWLDGLLEAGDPVAAELRAHPEGPASLGPALDAARLDGALKLEWRQGFIRRALIRRVALMADVRQLVYRLLRTPLAWLLVELEVPSWEPWLLMPELRLRALRTLRVGPYFVAEEAARARRALAEADVSHLPFLQRREVLAYRTAWVDFADGRQRALRAGQSVSLSESELLWEPSQSTPGWVARAKGPSTPVRHNGRSCLSAPLVPGDELICRGGERFVFRAEP